MPALRGTTVFGMVIRTTISPCADYPRKLSSVASEQVGDVSRFYAETTSRADVSFIPAHASASRSDTYQLLLGLVAVANHELARTLRPPID